MTFTLDRRAFLGAMGFSAGAVVASVAGPLSVVHAMASGGVAMTEPAGFGSVDDACGHWPPYSHPIPYSRPAVAASAGFDPIDHIFLT
ncbi:MAG: hypothetical protein ABI885_25415 [Gammaproteobacteria bacterium]